MLAKCLAALAASLAAVSAQTYQRLGTCPTLGCILPPDQQDFLPGQYFDLRLEVHAPVNGTEAFNDGKPDESFTVTIKKEGAEAKSIEEFFSVEEPEIETWTFGWFEDLFAEDAGKQSIVNVASKIYRKIALYEPGDYTVTLTYYDGQTTEANWVVRPIANRRKAKNIIFFIGDGMTTNAITAARLLGHKSVNGKYQSLMAMDKFPVIGHQMTHSIDGFITDSANSASALYSGHKSTVNAIGVYADSSEDTLDDPKVETLPELFMRIWDGVWGAVSTAAIADATPISLLGHSRSRYDYGALVDMTLNGAANWTETHGPEVWIGGGAEQFYPNEDSFNGEDYYAAFSAAGYNIALNKTALEAAPSSEKLLSILCQSHLPVWLDRNVFTENLAKFKNDPTGTEDPALDLPGLKEMTLKAVDILATRGSEKGFFLMSEAASVDKELHKLDYDRALGDILELDDAVKATLEKLEELGIKDETLVVVSADHGHGFDVFGSVDTAYLEAQDDDRQKRRAVGTYAKSGLSLYQSPIEGVNYGTGPNFPVNWDPRYTLGQGFAAMPDHRENYRVHKDGSRKAAAELEGKDDDDYYANAKDSTTGYLVNGTLPVDHSQGVHSLTDVPVYALGPCQEIFGGTYSNIDVFYKMAECLGLGHAEDPSCKSKSKKKKGSGHHN